MKNLCVYAFMIIFLPITYSAQTETEKKVIKNIISEIESAFNNEKSNAIEKYFSDSVSFLKFRGEIFVKQVLPQFMKQIPKGKWLIQEIVQEKKCFFVKVIINKQMPLQLHLNSSFLVYQIIPPGANKNSATENQKVNGGDLVIPFHLINGYILVETKINNQVNGLMLWDTGNPEFLSLNTEFFGSSKGETIGKGNAASGQTFDVYKMQIDSVESFGLQLGKRNNVLGWDMKFMQNVMGNRLIGSFGKKLMENFEMGIDYETQTIFLFKIDSLGRRISKPEKNKNLVAEIPFGLTENMPSTTFKAGSSSLQVRFDCGAHFASAHAKWKKIFEENKLIEKFSSCSNLGQAENDFESFLLKEFAIGENSLTNLQGLTFDDETNEQTITLGYEFLKNYISCWNFKTKKIILYKNRT